jgi:TetR/AcrR family transcriptional regulator, transcriptional repressor for nem operon
MTTRDSILSSAQHLVQQRGYNGFSYADIADEVGIRKASLHHHFPTKTDLGLALIERYAADFEDALQSIDAAKIKADTKLLRYVALYRATLEADRMCLCGMLSTEALTLDAALLPKLRQFFERNTEWLAAILSAGRDDSRFQFSGSATDHARAFQAALQGALMMARASGDAADFDHTIKLMSKNFTAKD